MFISHHSRDALEKIIINLFIEYLLLGMMELHVEIYITGIWFSINFFYTVTLKRDYSDKYETLSVHQLFILLFYNLGDQGLTIQLSKLTVL